MAAKRCLAMAIRAMSALLRPASRGSVMLASADAMQAPLIDPAFSRNVMTWTVHGSGFVDAALLQQPALAGYRGQELPVSARAQTDEQIEQFIRNHGDTIYHPVVRAAWAMARPMWWTPGCASTACRGCGWSTHRSCRASSGAPTRRPS